MERFTNKIAVVTGSSSGIGASLSEELVKHGVNVVGVARRIEKLKELSAKLSNSNYPGKFYALKCDVSNEQEIKDTFEWIRNQLGPVSILVNNAGVLMPSFITDITAATISTLFDINVKGAILCSKEAMNSMIENSTEGHIININSILGRYITSIEPNMYSIYSSSKHALRIISEGLRQEIIEKNVNIKVTNISPGYVITEMTDAIIADFPRPTSDKALEAQDVADTCIAAINTAPNVLISELTVVPIHQKI